MTQHGSAASSEFTSAGGPGFARRGLAGSPIRIANEGAGLLLTGPDSRVLRIAIEHVERLRLGFERSRNRRYYSARLFLVGEEKPLLIMPMEGHEAGYAATMRCLAHAVAGARGLSRVERGLTVVRMVAFITLFSAVAIGVSTIFLLFAPAGELAGPLAFAAAMAAVIAIYAWIAMRTEMPKGVASLEEIERFLPG